MSVVLTILSIFLWIFLGLLGLVLFLILLILFLMAVPVKYSVDAKIGGNSAVLAKVTYLFRLVRFTYEYRDGVSETDIRVAWFKIGGKKNAKPPKSLAKIIKEATEQAAKEAEKEVAKEAAKEAAKKPEKKPEKKAAKKNQAPEPPPPKKENLFKRISKAYAVLTDSQGKTIIKLVLAALKKSFKAVLPKRLEVSGAVGLSNPASTAFLMGGYEAVAGIFNLREKIRLAGDFNADSTTIRLNAKAQGSVSVLRLSWPFLCLVARKPIRKLIWRSFK